MLNKIITAQLIALLIQINALAVDTTENLQEADKIAQNIEAAIQNNNPSYINKLFSYNCFLSKVCNQDYKFVEFNKQFSKEITLSLDPGNILIEQLNAGGKYSFLSSFQRNGNIVIVFRVHTRYGIDYNELTFEMIDGNLRISDIYMYFESTLLSEMVSDIYTLMAQSSDSELFSAEELLYTNNTLKEEQKLLRLSAGNKYGKCLKYWAGLDSELKYNKKIMLHALRAASYHNTEELIAIYNIYNQKFETNNGVELMLLEGLFAREEYKQTLLLIDKLDKRLHRDPYLQFLRASVYKAQNESDKAEWFLKSFIEEFPKEEAGYFGLLELYLENKKFNNATLLLDEMSNTFGFFKEELIPLLINYPEYSNSAEYTRWIGE